MIRMKLIMIMRFKIQKDESLLSATTAITTTPPPIIKDIRIMIDINMTTIIRIIVEMMNPQERTKNKLDDNKKKRT